MAIEPGWEKSTMGLSNNIDHLAQTDGVESVAVKGSSLEYRGNERWHWALEGAIDLLRRTGDPALKFKSGAYTITVQKEGEETVAVASPAGHALSKSLRRMVRRMAKRDRGPVVERATLDNAATPQAQPQIDPSDP